ncbi:MAG TPA: secretin N-terminal domain-containing protein, partial [Rhodocyclaceae bacterium]|nr:secretin N-terminal domain-containing protein [Rhodocyclaceae bacterium]
MNSMLRTTALWTLFAVSVAGCSTSNTRPGTAFDRIDQELRRAAAERAAPVRPEAVERALLAPPPEPPKAPVPAEPRFDLVVSNAPAGQVFMAIVSGTRYSMLLPPEVAGTISVNLKNVTVREALDTLRELYGYEYRLQGTRIFIQPVALQTRVFQVNYLFGQRQGKSVVGVTSSSISTAAAGTAQTGGAALAPVIATPGAQIVPQESSRIVTQLQSDFWAEVAQALRAIVPA